MGTGYTRIDTANNIADGNVINAQDFDDEFDGIVAAFVNTTGHDHDGTAANGAPITKFGPSQEVQGDASALFPASDGVTDLGKSTKEWKDLYIDGVINTDNMSADTATMISATITNNASVGGTFNVGGATTLTGAASLSNTLAVSADSAFKGAVSVETTLRVTGDTDVEDLSASGTFDVAGTTNLATAVITGTVNIVGETTLDDISASGTLDIAGETNLATASITGTVNVTGDTTLDNVTASGTLNVAGETNLATATITGNVSADGTLNISGNGSVGGTFNVEGDLKNTSGNLTVDPATQIFEIKGSGSTEGQIQLNCAVNTHGQIITAADHGVSATNTLTLPGGDTIGNANATLVSDTGTQTLTNKTLTSPAINGATIDTAVSISSTGTLNAGTNADINGTLDVGSTASVGGALRITDNVTASGTLNVGTDASVSGTFNVTGSAGLSGNVNIGNATADIAIVSSQVEFQNNLRERTNVSTTSATGVLNFDVLSHNVELRTNDAAANFELNIRGDASTSFANTVATGETTSIAFESSQGGTAYYLEAIQIDGTTASPVYWQGGTAPSSGNVSSVDSYLINITRTTGTANYTCLASQTQYGKVDY